MPINNIWRQLEGGFLYKPQDFQNSCFAACLQMALANFDLIGDIQVGKAGRPTEQSFYSFIYRKEGKNIDESDPTISMVNKFMTKEQFLGRNKIDIKIIDPMMEADIKYINKRIKTYTNIAIIGAIKVGGGHANMIIKIDDNLFGVNPIQEGPYFVPINRDDVKIVINPDDDSYKTILCVPMSFYMEYIYIIAPLENDLEEE